MGTSHRGTRDSVSSRGGADPSAKDIDTRSEDVNEGTIVAEARLGVADVDGADGDGVGGRRGRVVLRVVVGVAGGYDGEDTLLVSGLDGGVEGLGA